MSYLAEFYRKYIKYTDKHYNDWMIAYKMLLWNAKYLFNGSSSGEDINLLKSNLITIAVRTNGGVGNVLIHCNFLKYFREYLGKERVELVVYGHPVKEVTDAIFMQQPFIDRYYCYKDLHEEDYKYYDLVIDIHSFPEILKINTGKIHALCPKLSFLLKQWDNFKRDDRYLRFFTLRPLLNNNIYRYSILHNNNCLNVADIDNVLGVSTKEYKISLFIAKDEKIILQSLGLKKYKYITLQRGVNPFSGTNESPKMWPVEYYNKLIKMLKEKYKNIKIVQLGESVDRCQLLDNVDVNLVGKTDWDDLKILLKNALYHIDGECGMVHIRKALKGGPSVVLFGPTPKDFFGYEDNINICTNICSHCCAALNDNWQKRCLKGNADCMSSITPELVINSISQYEMKPKTFEKQTIVDKIIGTKYIKLDEIWADTWLKKQEILAYEIVKIKISDLYIFKFENNIWIKTKLLNSPAVQYLLGNKKEYEKYCKYKNSHVEGDYHSIERFQTLIDNYNYDSQIVSIVINKDNCILDGQHRASILLNQNPDIKIKALKLYW